MTSQRQNGTRPAGALGGRCTARIRAFGFTACAVTSNVPSSKARLALGSFAGGLGLPDGPDTPGEEELGP